MTFAKAYNLWDKLADDIQALQDLSTDAQECESCAGRGYTGFRVDMNGSVTEIDCHDCHGFGIRLPYNQEAAEMVAREMDLNNAVVDRPAADVGDMGLVSFNQPSTSLYRLVGASPENLIQAGRALTDIAETDTAIIQLYTSVDGKGGVILRTPGEKCGVFSLNAVLHYGRTNNINLFSVRKYNVRQDGKCFESQHPGFNFRFNRNRKQGFDGRFTVTKHCIAALILQGVEVVFVNPTGERLDPANCWQLVTAGMEWEYTWLNSRQ